MAIGYGVAYPKPEKRSTTKGRKDRREGTLKKSVRAQCVTRDGYCRLAGIGPWDCSGFAEWAHLEEKRRAKTRGMVPEARHTTTHSLMLCGGTHHAKYDTRALKVRLLTARGADGPLRWIFPDGSFYDEPDREA